MGLHQLNTQCSAGCGHCPFTRIGIQYSFEAILQQIEQDSDAFVTISGGEPLEHPDLHKILEVLHLKQIPFRIATGGHIPLDSLILLTRRWPEFLGISFGTDVMSSRNQNAGHKQQWLRNLRQITRIGIPWSLTLTLGRDWNPQPFLVQMIYNAPGMLVCQKDRDSHQKNQEHPIHPKPDFLMINHPDTSDEFHDIRPWLKTTPWGSLPCL